jgi:hypothetical protein
MKVGPFDVRTLDDCLDIVEIAFKSSMWKQLPQEEKTRLVGRLSHILEITEKQELSQRSETEEE